MKARVFKLAKTLLAAVLIWLALTGVLVALDNAFELTRRFGWFPVAGVLFPFCLSALYVVVSLHSAKPQKKGPHHKSPVKEAQFDTPQANVPFPPTGNPQLDAAMAIVDAMDGHDFEQFCAELLDKCGYKNIHVTKGSGDQGVDIIAVKYGVRYAFQCKRYSSKLGNKPVQEVHTGKQFYSCQKGVVITNSYFTRGAEEAARRVEVELWDRDTIIRKMGYQIQTAHGGVK